MKVNQETGLQSGENFSQSLQAFLKEPDGDAQKKTFFVVGNPGRKEMTVAEALEKDAEQPGSVGTDETWGVP